MVKANKSKNNFKNLKTVSINNLSHFYGKNENKKQVLNDVNLSIDKGELVLLKGPSGHFVLLLNISEDYALEKSFQYFF